jgi:hypothetical protein
MLLPWCIGELRLGLERKVIKMSPLLRTSFLFPPSAWQHVLNVCRYCKYSQLDCDDVVGCSKFGLPSLQCDVFYKLPCFEISLEIEGGNAATQIELMEILRVLFYKRWC